MSKVVGVIVSKVEVAVSCCTFSIVCFFLLRLFGMRIVRGGKFLSGWWVLIYTLYVSHYCVCVSHCVHIASAEFFHF